MREHLLGYLLGAIEDDERRQVEQAIECDPQLQQELKQLEARLDVVDAAAEVHDPPAGLAERTCRLVALQQDPERVSPRPAPTAGWSMADVVVAAGIFAAAALLFFPAIISSKYQSDLATCQNNLRQLGVALSHYTDFNNGYFPRVPTSGNRAGAGIYGPLLVEAGMISDSSLTVCPSSELARQRFNMPTLEEIDSSLGARLEDLRRRMGGSYGYNLGYFSDDIHHAPRHEGRPTFAIMADAPSEHLTGRQSSNHGGRGQNVLFDDWHVRYLVECKAQGCGDALYLNRAGHPAAGLGPDDAVLGSSSTPPIVFQTISSQR